MLILNIYDDIWQLDDYSVIESVELLAQQYDLDDTTVEAILMQYVEALERSDG